MLSYTLCFSYPLFFCAKAAAAAADVAAAAAILASAAAPRSFCERLASAFSLYVCAGPGILLSKVLVRDAAAAAAASGVCTISWGE